MEDGEVKKMGRWDADAPADIMDQMTYGVDSIFIKANGTRISTDKHG